MANLFNLNKIEFKKFSTLMLSLQMAFLGAILLDLQGMEIPIIRQLIGTICILFIPGWMFTKIMRLNKLGTPKLIMHSLGLSISLLMCIGVLVNLISLYVPKFKPISYSSIILAFNALIIISIIFYFLNNNQSKLSICVAANDFLHLKILPLYFLPILAVLGAYYFNYFDNNELNLIILIIIAVISILISIDESYPARLYPMAIWLISLSLLFHSSLISNYIWGWDICQEYLISNQVIRSGSWNATIPSNINGMLSITILPPFFSNLLYLNIIWVYKIMFPFILSLLPVALYETYKEQTDTKIALMSCLFFMFNFVFFNELLSLARQQICELFFALVFLSLVDKNISKAHKSILMIIYTFSMSVSHYALSYIFIFMSLMYFTIMGFLYIYNKNYTKDIISVKLISAYIAFSIAWYIYVSSSSSFISAVDTIHFVINSIISDLFNPHASQLANIVSNEDLSITKFIAKYINFIFLIFIFAGIVKVLLVEKEKFNKNYLIYSIIIFITAFTFIVLPGVSGTVGISRFYHISLLLLSPFAIIGGLSSFFILKFISDKLGIVKLSRKNLTLPFSVIISLLFLFNSGAIMELAEDKPVSISLNKSIDYPIYNEQELQGAEWLYVNGNCSHVYADLMRSPLLASFGILSWSRVNTISAELEDLSLNDYYIYFGTFNILKNKLIVPQYTEGVNLNLHYINISKISKNKIYANSGAEIYFS